MSRCSSPNPSYTEAICGIICAMARSKLAEKPIQSTANPRQKRLARKLVEAIQTSEPITGAEIVASVGYGLNMQRKPGEVINAQGVQDELAIMGFTEHKAKEVVAVILGDEEQKAGDRLKAAGMVFEVFGTYAPEKNITIHYTPDPKSVALANEFEEKLKSELQ